MTPEIALVLAILVTALVLFFTEVIRMDVVALLVLGVVALTGLVTPAQALSGFSNPAVVTVWAMFMLSHALTKTGVAGLIGRHMLRLAGRGEVRTILIIMLTAGGMSAFMNNIGVAALLLPVVMDVARRTRRAPSRLLLPLAYGSLLGGLTTLIGTPPNLLASNALLERDLEPFSLFDFTPLGALVMLSGTVFIAVAGRHLLPSRAKARDPSGLDGPDLREQYSLHEHTILMRIRPGSLLVGKSLRESRLGSATALNVYAIIRAGSTRAAPLPESILQPGDRLLVGGRLDRFNELRGWRELVIEAEGPGLEQLVSAGVELAELRIAEGSPLAGRTLGQTDFRNRFGLIVLALQRDSTLTHSNLVNVTLAAGDRLLVQGRHERFAELRGLPDFDRIASVSETDLRDVYTLPDLIFTVRIPPSSILAGKSLAASRLGDALGLGVLGLIREGRTRATPSPDEELRAGDRLLVRGRREDLDVFRGLQKLEIESEAPREFAGLESEQVGLVEAMLSPRTQLAGMTLRQLDFRRKYGLQVLAVLREGTTRRSGLRDMALRFGDALLLLGPRDRLEVLAREPDFLVLTQAVQETPQPHKAPVALAIMVAVLLPVVLGWLSIPIAAVGGVALMILSRCMGMDEAYRAVEWKSIFLIAGMLPLGTAIQETGAANYLAEGLLASVGSYGPWAMIAALYLGTTLATSAIPTTALVVLMAPIVIRTSTEMGISPHAVMMAVAIAASASFTSPISHPANVLVMGPGGYRFVDYVKLGVPLTLVVMIVALLLLPIFWPLHP